MRLSCLSLVLVTIFAVLIVHAPQVQARTEADAEAEAEAVSKADALADPGWVAFFRAIKHFFMRLFKALAPSVAIEAGIETIKTIDIGKNKTQAKLEKKS